jgi:phenylacetate-CoA ligase
VQDLVFDNIILPLYYRFKRQNRFNYYKILKKRNLLTTEELLNIQCYKLKALLNHCYKNVPFYSEMFKTIGITPDDIKSVNDFSKLPELGKHNIRDNYKLLINKCLKEKEITFSATGGSTGTPLKIYKSIKDQEYGYALRYRSNAWCGWELHKRSAWLVADLKRLEEISSSPSAKMQAGLWIKRKLMLDTRDTRPENMYKWVEQIKRFKPEYVYGYSTLIAEFANFLINNNIKIDGIKGVFSTAEPLLERTTMQKAFNSKVFDQYGSSEIPCIAHECKNGNMHLNVDEVIAEFVDIPQTNGLKKIVCTPLYIYGMPLLRYDLGDIAVASDKKCDCGLPYPVIELKVGRISDNLLAPKGKIVPTANLGWHIVNLTTGINQYQILQKEVNFIIVRLDSSEKHREENESIIKDLLGNLLESNRIKIIFEYPEKILPESNGKFRPVISEAIQKSKSTYIS